MPTLVVIDGSSFLYRAFHALPPLTNAEGEPTGAIHGFLAMQKRLQQAFAPEYLAVVFDAPGGSFRDQLYSAYKAQRAPMPDDLVRQLEPLYAIVDAQGLTRLVIPGVEADDVIATLARMASEAGIATLIASSDKDLAQLVDADVRMVAPMELKVIDAAGVELKFGVRPDQIIDFLTLTGDAVDNVPGVAKVGPKTAARWLGEHGSLDVLLANADKVPGKLGEALREAAPRLPLSRTLVSLDRHVDLTVTLEALKPGSPDVASLRQWYTRLGMQSLLRELGRSEAESLAATTANRSAGAAEGPDSPTASSFAARYHTLLEAAEFLEWIERLRAAPLIAFDTETTSLDYMEARLVGVSFAVTADEAAYVPLAHDHPGSPSQLPLEFVMEHLGPLLADPARPKLGHHLKYDAHVLANHGIELRGITEDTLIESYVLDSTASRHDLDTLALGILQHRNISYESVTGKGASAISFSGVDIATATAYAAEDSAVCLALHDRLRPRLSAIPALDALYRDLEMPLVPVLFRMERQGVLIDVGRLAAQGVELARTEAAVAAEAERVAGRPFNLGSPLQIQQLLFDELKLRVIERTPKGQPSTAESVLSELAHEHELPRLILEHRSLAKLRSTYIEKLPQQVNPHTGRVHTSYHQAVAATGRLSSSDPNLQNIPVRTTEGRRIRQAFIAPPGQVLLAADYSQIELRIMAHLSADDGLTTAFAAGADVHRMTAAEVFGLAPEAVGDAERRAAKAINFGLIYGMSAFGLARQLGIERGAADRYIERYFQRYPGVRDYMERTRAQAHSAGYVETLFGRRLYLPEINSRQAARRQYAERTAINAPMQGTAADIIKRAMLEVFAWLEATGFPARMIMQVHDELVFEVAREAADELAATVQRLMTGVAHLGVPLVVDCGKGENWDEAH
jgi:DNA polymerase I